jgi:hypothetical protein
MHLAEQARYNSLYLLYFTGTKVQILTQTAALMHLAEQARYNSLYLLYFTGTKVQILTQTALRC